ncbi:uncharacterized protein LAESUDRAFT_694916 [Laetiporus sulphureus 93-53]|uniref:Trs120-domain-containing protein n=1 Tax=Laetiporus sulphureus 93-53 TaxID=1314785 RepID=A0A165FUM8_9APHY|nr:uncharacterized protein LAESUDRAFT_694916 [Laetiporus sulphureus 93-53]KZT09435.1 hypothetical protein LAESUDRAFT_694916 [Laetiporus sulphureus 93-53]
MESQTFASLAHVRILLLPFGDIRRSTYDKWASEIRSFESIPLGDIPADTRDERARFMPGPLASGHIHLSFSSHLPPPTRGALALFRPSDLPLGVIGIASCSHSDALPSTLSSFTNTLRELSSNGTSFETPGRCLVFEESDANLDVGDGFPGLVVIPSVMGHKRMYIGTLLAELCSDILGEFAVLMQSLETPLGNEYLNASLFPLLPPPSELPRSLDPEFDRHDSLPPLPSQHSQPELSLLNGSTRSKTPLSRRISTGPGLFQTRHASLPTSPAPMKKRPAAIGAVSSHGRLFKVLADLFLLAGRHADSLIWYTEAIALFKGPQDAIWHASALEGLATIPVVQAWSSSQAATLPAGDKDPWQDINDKLVQAIALYFKTPPQSDHERTYPLQAYLYIQAVLRQTTLLLTTWCAKGWGPQTYARLVHPGPHPYTLPVSADTSTNADGVTITVKAPPRELSYADMERLTTISGISRSQIASVLAQIHGPWLLHLDARERINTLQTVAGMFGVLGYLRKEAYILRELLGSVMDLIVCGRDEGGRTSNPGLGIQRNGSEDHTSNHATVGVRENQRDEGNDAMLRIVKHVCRVHGVDLEAVKLVDISARHSQPGVEEQDVSDEIAEQEEEQSVDDPFGWPELQIGIVREAIAVAEALPDYPSVAQFSLSSLKMLHPVMSQSDQFHLYHTATRAMATAIRRGDRRLVEYWAGRPLTSIEVLPLPLIRMPVEKPMSLLTQSQQPSSTNPLFVGVKDPFLYNPRKLMSEQVQSVLVQNERFEAVVTLRNPFVFDLQLESVALSTSGVRVESEAMAVIVPANTYHPITISGKALEAGTLVIRGCVVQAPGGAPREYVLPLSTEEEEDRRLRRRSAVEFDAGRSKRTGLDSRPWKRANTRLSKQNAATFSGPPTVRFLECKVVPEQPLLQIKRTSLTHGAVMLYEGETSIIRLTLENVSALSVDFIRLSFDDSTMAPAQEALADGELSVSETYETEYDLIHRPVFTWDSTRDVARVDPGEKATIVVKCFGKVGCVNGAIHVSYGYARRDTAPEKPANVFHTRQLSYPVTVTVYQMLECHSMDILPYSEIIAFASKSADEESSATKVRKALLNVDDVEDWCLFSVEVRNTYGSPFEVTFVRTEPDTASTTTLVAPGSTARLVIPIKKIHLSEEDIAKPIPTLSDRQFVVTKSNLSSAEVKAQRELFWYREELFKVIHGRWRETGGTRVGDLSLRQQRITLPMLEVLRTETARVKMSLHCFDEDDALQPVAVDPSGSKYLPPPNGFVYLRTKVINLSPTDMILSVSLSMEPAQYVISQGVLVDIPLGRVAHGESHEIEIPVAFVSRGRFNLSAEVLALGQPASAGPVGRGQLTAVVEDDFT